MANGKIRFGKQSGGELALVIPDGVDYTEVIIPESGVLATKDYADLKVALTDFTGTNVSRATNGYQKLPSGLIIQWGAINVTTFVVVNLPISYPNQQLFNIAGDRSGLTPTRYFGTDAGSATQFTIFGSSGDIKSATWLSFGY